MDKIKIFEYVSKKGKEYFITHIDNKPYFVILKNIKKDNLTLRTNIKKEILYYQYDGNYKILNDLVII